MLKKLLFMGIIPLATIAVFTALEAVSLLAPVEHRAYDLALAVRPEPPVNPDLLLVAVDDPAIEYSKTVWPWPRDLMAKGLLRMKEFGARQVVFDILYEQPSAPGINASAYAGATETYDAAFAGLKEYFLGLEDSLRRGTLPLRQFPQAAEQYAAAIDATKRELLDRLSEITENRDEMLGNAAQAFGHAFFAVNLSLEAGEKPGEGLAGLDPAWRKKLFVEKAAVKGRISASAADIIPPIAPVLRGARALGFPVTESQIDQPDGVTRRIDLFYRLQDRAIPQLGLAALLDYLGNPAVEIRSDSVTLQGARQPGSDKPTDIVIPLSEDGAMLINWTRKNPQDSYKSVSFKELLELDQIENDIVYNLRLLAAQQESGGYVTARGPSELLAAYYAPVEAAGRDLLAGRTRTDADGYRRAQDDFVAALERSLTPAAEEELVGSVRTRQEPDRRKLVDLARAALRANREYLAAYKERRDDLAAKMRGAICFTSWTATSTTDIGVTPFSGTYVNVGTHMTVVNTILQGRFLDDSPRWTTSLITAVFTLAAFFLVFAVRRPLLSVLAGLGTFFALAAGLLLVFVLTGVYLGLVSPLASVFLVFVVFTVVNYLSTAREKNFIRNAFSRYVSKEVITELISDPSKLNLGGESKNLTALFTDIKGFSGFSEKLAPPRLVNLLNGYFTGMANIILGLKGTLDKYVGDAIISFFGAPIPLERHAHAACLAAVRMKQTERLMNEKLSKEKLAPRPLLTRIGINTGEMLVGNMGSEDRLNYTIMGHHVNLTSRLEGVNKQYGTWILLSESTQRSGGAAFLTRRLDRVRVVGVTKPVRLFELIDEKSLARPELFEAVEIFHRALDLFEKRDWDKARAGFKEVLKIRPEDAPAQFYISRCAEYKRKPPAPDWDGVFTLSTK